MMAATRTPLSFGSAVGSASAASGLSFGSAVGSAADAKGGWSLGTSGSGSSSRRTLSFGGDPIVDPWQHAKLSYGSGVPAAPSRFSDLMNSFGLSFGIGGGDSGGSYAGTPIASVAGQSGVTTGQIDGAAPVLDGIKGLAAVVLSRIGAGGGDSGGSSARPQLVAAQQNSGGGIQPTTLLLIAGAGIAAYLLVRD